MISKDWQSLLEGTYKRRHWLHQHPELKWEEQATAAFIRQQLTAMEIPWRSCAGTGTVACLAPTPPSCGAGHSASGQSGQSGQSGHLAFRADIDALPIEETSGLPYTSLHPGKMHACGHDGHTAALLATAEWFKGNEAVLPGPVSFLFQPAEEGGHGAQKMIEDGALDGIDAIYGWHNWPAMRLGQAACPEGAVMSGNATFHIRLKGRGGHASQPEAARDPVLGAAALVVDLQQIVSRRLPPQVPAVVSVTSIDARSSLTVIPEHVRIEGSIRFSDSAWRDPIFQWITEISQRTAAAYGVEASVETVPRYDATVNHALPSALYREALSEHFGEPLDAGDIRLPLMASEDFSYYLKKIPGAFALIGMAEANQKETICNTPCHSPSYVFNDAVLEPVVKVFSRIAGMPVPPGSSSANHQHQHRRKIN